jgi:hypothetical protein
LKSPFKLRLQGGQQMRKIAVILVGFSFAIVGCGEATSPPLWEWEKNNAAAKKFDCSDLTQSRWEELRAKKNPPRALTGFAIKLRSCKTLIGMTRKELYGFLGKPDRSGQAYPNTPRQKYASWVVGYDRLFGDEIALTTRIRQERVTYVENV